VLRAALLQFEDSNVSVSRFPEIRTEAQVVRVAKEAVARRAMVVHTLVSFNLRRVLYIEAVEHHVPVVDLFGTLMTQLESFLESSPQARPGLMQEADERYYERVDALDFAVKHDDGLGLASLGDADVVLVGISRTSKTPLSIYLAYRALKVANVPIILGVDPPRELYDIDQTKIVGLVMNPERMVRVRSARLRQWGMTAPRDYADPGAVQEELAYSKRIFNEGHPWPVVNVTGKSVEEMARDVMSLIVGRDKTRE
jgi:regulator of PEP synthase PpsR (kinase-PPPase family)